MDYQKLKKYLSAFSGYNRYNGVTIAEIGDGSSVIRVDLTPNSRNPQGWAHGGLIFSMCDTAAGVACMSHGTACATQHADIHYLRPGQGNFLLAAARELRYGRHTGVYSVEVTNEQGVVAAHATVTMFLTGEKFDF